MKRNIIKKIILIIMLAIILPTTSVFGAVKNNNPLLIEITIDGKPINPEFDQFITDYVIAVDSTTDKIDIEAVTDDPNATAEIIGETNLKPGINDFEIKVTAEDGKTTNSYFLHITKGNVEKANANLKDIEIKGLTLNPQFNEKDTSYFVEYEGYIEKLDIVAYPESEKAKVKILNNENISGSIHIVTIEVTAEDGITTKEYKITAKKSGENLENQSGLEEHEEELKKVNQDIKKENGKLFIGGITAVILISMIIIFIMVKRGKKS